MQLLKLKLPKNLIKNIFMTIRTYIIIVSTTFIHLLGSVNAQQNANQELMQLVNKSFTYNPRINELQQQVFIQTEKIDIAKTFLLPSINASASYSYIDPFGKATFPLGTGVEKVIQFQPNNNLAFGLGINYQVFDFGRARANIDKTKTEILQSKDNVEFSKVQLAAQIATIYYSITYLKNAVTVQDSILSSLNQTKKQTEIKLKIGDALELDVLTINSNIDAEKNRKVELENLLQKQYNVLLYSTGEKNVNQSNPDFNFSVVNNLATQEEIIKQAEENNLDFNLTKHKKVLTINEWNINKRAYYPSVNLIGNAGMRNGYQPNIDELRFNYLVGVSLNAPLFQGGRFKQQKQLFETTTKLNDLALTTLKKNYERDIAQSLIDINSYTTRLINVKGQINQAEKVLELINTRYKNGIALQIEYINALTILQKIKLSALNYEYQKCLAEIELTRLIGNKWW